MKGVFLDSVAAIALWNERDQWHSAAMAAYRALLFEEAALFTTTYVIAECANAFARRPREPLINLVERVEAQDGLIRPTEAEWQSAWSAFTKGHIGSPGLVDLLSFAIMRRLGLTRVLTNDLHFVNAGFVVLF